MEATSKYRLLASDLRKLAHETAPQRKTLVAIADNFEALAKDPARLVETEKRWP